MKSGLACVVAQAVRWTTPEDAVYVDCYVYCDNLNNYADKIVFSVEI